MSNKKLPFLASPLKEANAEQLERAVKLLRNDPQSKQTARETVKAIMAVTETSLTFYFIRPMDKVKVGVISRNIVKMGVNAGLGVLNTFGGRLLSSLSKEQKLELADLLEEIIIYIDPEEAGIPESYID